MKNWIRCVALLLAADLLAGSKPNIIIMFADDMGYGEVHALNPERGKIPTPHLDQMAADGMVFTDAHTASSVCTPSRYALMTGRYCWRTRLQSGVVKGHAEPLIAADRLTMAGMLKEMGYSTAISGKWHLSFNYEGEGIKGKNVPVGTKIPDGPLTRGFDTYFGFHHAREMQNLIKDDTVIEHIDPEQMLPRTTDFAVDYINSHAEEAKNGKPFFLYMAFGSPHNPIVPTKEWIGKSGLGPYGDFVMMTDGMAGRIIEAVETNGLAKDTIILFSSDNGTSSKPADLPNLQAQGHYPSADLRGAKSDLWDGGHRVPFIMRWDGQIKAGTQSDHLVCLSDMMATLAELTGYTLPATTAEDSYSFLPVLSGSMPKIPREAIVHHSISGRFAIRQDQWKLLLCPGSGGWSDPRDKVAGKSGAPEIQLYNMETDKSETTNLQDQEPERVQQLIALLESYVDRGRSTSGPELSNDEVVDIWKKHRNDK